MSLPIAPLDRAAQAPRHIPDHQATRYVPPWVRDEQTLPPNVVPLRLPVAPDLVPAASDVAPAMSTAAPQPDIDLLIDEAAIRVLLQRRAPDSPPLIVKPMRDPIGLALGMVARLTVAGCAAAVVAMLLTGIIPLPFRFAAEQGETTAVAPASAWSPPVVAELTINTAPSRNGHAAAAAVAPPGRVATVSVRAAPAGVGDQGALDAAEAERLIKRGEDYLAQGDIAAARLILGRAAEAGEARAAYALAATYDPAVLKALRVVGFRPELDQARAWYAKAAGYGSAEAARRLATLPDP
jgi:hypothetical protein